MAVARSRLASALAVAFALALSGQASAALITPHAATPQTVTPHAVEAAPEPAPEAEEEPEGPQAPEEPPAPPAEPPPPPPWTGPDHARSDEIPESKRENLRPDAPDSGSPDCTYDCQSAWLDWGVKEWNRNWDFTVQADELVREGFEAIGIEKVYTRIGLLQGMLKDVGTYLSEHELEHTLEQLEPELKKVLDIAHPWGPDPMGGQESGRVQPCRNGNVVDANDEVEDSGSGSAACR
jgi:hypothetical protein